MLPYNRNWCPHSMVCHGDHPLPSTAGMPCEWFPPYSHHMSTDMLPRGTVGAAACQLKAPESQPKQSMQLGNAHLLLLDAWQVGHVERPQQVVCVTVHLHSG